MTTARRAAHRALYAVVGFTLLVRILDAVMLVVAGQEGRPDSSPWEVYQDVTTSWDGGWYASIADEGYPRSAVGPDGTPVQTSLAFYPLFPLASRGISALTGLPFSVVGPALSLVAGTVATALVFRLLQRAVGVNRAALACFALAVYPAAPVLQVAYTESLALALVAAALLLIQGRRYLWATLPVLALGLTRNISLVLAVVVVAHWVTVWRAGRRPSPATRPPASAVPHARLAVLLASTAVAALLWPAVVGVLTGDPHAYTTTMKAWPGFSSSVLRPPWVQAVGSAGTGSLFLAVIVVLCFAALMSLPLTRAWGVELWSWTVAYPIYIFLATGVSMSIVRYLLLAFPLALAVAPPVQTRRDQIVRALMVVVWCVLGLAGQYLWINYVLVRQDPTQHWGFP